MFDIDVVKRDGSVVEFEPTKITKAITKCLDETGNEDKMVVANTITQWVTTGIQEDKISVEKIQDMVERGLMIAKEYEAAKAYILFREKKAQLRKEKPVPDNIRKAFDFSSDYFKSPLQQFQFFDKYSRFNYGKARRETWAETVGRAVNFLRELSEDKLSETDYHLIYNGILNMDVMPSMRLLAMAGPAARRNNATIYNCSYMPVDGLRTFVEALIISMSGCGVGFSVESRYVDQLPEIKEFNPLSVTGTHTVVDSSEGWAEALRIALSTWFDGMDVMFDYSELRPAGAILKTKGGRSSGPEVLRNSLSRIREIIISRQKTKLRPIDAHDIMCLVGDAAVQGGTRRSAMISLFDFDDQEMMTAKNGDFYVKNAQRWNANNSAVWPERLLSQAEIMKFFNSVVESGTGEPGIFNRRAARITQPEWRDKDYLFGTNPCGEIILRPRGFCNLTSVVCREDDTVGSLHKKVRLATIIGTIQSLATNFPGLSEEWVKNAEEERLLGVDLNAHMDSPVARNAFVQGQLQQHAIDINLEYSSMLGINRSASVTCVKPSGNSSTLLNTSSGIHPRWSKYYVRNVRVSSSSPLRHVMKDAGVPMSPENGQTAKDATTWVIHFPVKSPEGAITRKDLTAIEKCDYWLQVKNNWTTHNPSVTITFTDNEVIDITKWIYENQEVIGGMAFLPQSDSKYDQMPYEEIDEQEYERLMGEFPDVDFSKVYRYESEDMTTAAQELACMSGACEF